MAEHNEEDVLAKEVLDELHPAHAHLDHSALLGRALRAMELPSIGHVMVRMRMLNEIIHVLFLNLSWDERQTVKRMMNDHQKEVLAKVLEEDGAEINW